MMEGSNANSHVYVAYNQPDYSIPASLNEPEGVNPYQTPLSKYASEGQAPIPFVEATKSSKCIGFIIILLIVLLVYTVLNAKLYKTEYTSYYNWNDQDTNTSLTVTYSWNKCDYHQTFLNTVNETVSTIYSYHSLCDHVYESNNTNSNSSFIMDQNEHSDICNLENTGKIWLYCLSAGSGLLFFSFLILFCPFLCRITDAHKLWKYSTICTVIASFVIFASIVPFGTAVSPKDGYIPCTPSINTHNINMDSDGYMLLETPLWPLFVSPSISIILWLMSCFMNRQRLNSLKKEYCCCSCKQCC